MRAFVAIDLPEDVAAAVEALQEGLPVGRPVPEDNLHLTLAFLGDVRVEDLELMHAGLEALPQEPVKVRMQGLEVMAAGGVLALKVAPGEPLVRLQKRVANAAREAGLTPDRRRFRPHVTIARLPRTPVRADEARLARFIEARATAAAFAVPPFEAAGFALYRSTLHPGGAVHEVLADYPLR